MEVPNSEYGAPWNDIDKEIDVTITIKTCVSVSFKGPAEISDSEIEAAVKEIVETELSKTEYSVESISLD